MNRNQIFEKSFHQFLQGKEQFDIDASDYMDAIISEMVMNPNPSSTMMEGWVHDLQRIKYSVQGMERRLINEGK